MEIDLPQVKQAHELLDNLETELKTIDSLIIRHAMMLDIIQPFAPGKISNRHISLRGGGAQEPVFVAWKWTPATRKTGKLSKYDILGTTRVAHYIKRYGPFRDTQKDVGFLLARIKRLIERRKALLLVLGKFSHAVQLSMDASARACQELEDGMHQEFLRMHDRHLQRVRDWMERQAAKAREAAELDGREAIPDPADLNVFYLPPLPPDWYDPREALPDEYLDEDGNYVGP